MQFWLGFAVVVALWRRAKDGPAPNAAGEIPGGSIAFVPACLFLIGCAGLLIGTLGSSIGVLGTVALYLMLGLAYGTTCWLLARNGYLPFPLE